MSTVFDLCSSHVHPIDIVGMPEIRSSAVCLRLVQDPDRDSTVQSCYKSISVPVIGIAEYNGINLLVFLVVMENGTISEAFFRRIINLRIFCKDRILARQRPVDVGIVSKTVCINPFVIVLGLETVDEGLVVSEVDQLVDVIAKRSRRHKILRAVIRRTKLQFVLAHKE